MKRKLAVFALVAVMACGVFYGCGTEPNSSALASTGSSQADVPSQASQTSSTSLQPVPPKDTRIVGTWKVDHFIVDGKTKSIEDYVEEHTQQSEDESTASRHVISMEKFDEKTMISLIKNISFEFQADGTLLATALSIVPQTSEGTYEVREDKIIMVLDGQEGELQFDADAGILIEEQDDGTKLVMKKE